MIDHVLLDMDGVLVDFISGALEIHNIKETQEEIYKSNPGEWDLMKLLNMSAPAFFKPMDEEFWAKLDWMPDGHQILVMLEKAFGQENITICSSPSENYGCIDGKKRWIERHLPRHYKHNTIFTNKKERCARSDTVLIDDSDKNILKFKEKGGVTYLVPRIWNSCYGVKNSCIKKLEDFINASFTKKDRQENQS